MIMQKHPTHKDASGFTLIELMTLSSYIAAVIHGEC
jgi:Tfp pilus assembly protein PilE